MLLIASTLHNPQLPPHYPQLPIKHFVDASSYGVGTVLPNVMPGNIEKQMAFASRSQNLGDEELRTNRE